MKPKTGPGSTTAMSTMNSRSMSRSAVNSNPAEPAMPVTAEKPPSTETKRDEFENTVLSSLAKLLSGQDGLRSEFETFKLDISKAVEFQGEEIEDLKKENKKQREETTMLDTKLSNAFQRTFENNKHVAELFTEVNRLERQTRRNNIRIIGCPEKDHENVMEIVDNILTQFKFEKKVEVERAHRDGRIYRGHGTPRPRHILICVLRYTDKVNILKTFKRVLKDEPYRFADDLTKVDLEEKKRWREEVADLYKKGEKLRFVGGMWRARNGKTAPFYNKVYKSSEPST